MAREQTQAQADEFEGGPAATVAEVALVSGPLKLWLVPDLKGKVPEVFLRSRTTLGCLQEFCDRRRDFQRSHDRQLKEAAFRDLTRRLGPKAPRLVLEYTRPLREAYRRRILCFLAQIAKERDYEQWLKIQQAFPNEWQLPPSSRDRVPFP